MRWTKFLLKRFSVNATLHVAQRLLELKFFMMLDVQELTPRFKEWVIEVVKDTRSWTLIAVRRIKPCAVVEMAEVNKVLVIV